MNDCDHARLDSHTIPVSRLSDALSRITNEVCLIELIKDGISARFTLEFCVASESDLALVETRFKEIVKPPLASRTVETFIGAKTDFSTAIGYCDGLCSYLYALLALKRYPHFALPSGSYEGRFSRAATTLRDYDRPLARTIRSVVEFHFNHFDSAAEIAPDSGVRAVSRRYSEWLSVAQPAAPFTQPNPRTVNHRTIALPTDYATANIIDWSLRSLDELAQYTTAIDSFIAHELPHYDKAKLRVLLGEVHVAAGNSDAALTQARHLRHTAPFEAWADNLILSQQR